MNGWIALKQLVVEYTFDDELWAQNENWPITWVFTETNNQNAGINIVIDNRW